LGIHRCENIYKGFKQRPQRKYSRLDRRMMKSLSEIKRCKIRLRLMIKGSPILYPVAKKLFDRRAEELLCNKNSNICIESYLSCANTYSYHLLKRLNRCLNIAHHCHSVANIKIALKYRIPVIVIIRHPEDAISSAISRFDHDMMTMILEYIEFYTFVKNHSQSVVLVPFDELTGETEKSIKRISKYTGLKLEYDDFNTLHEEIVESIETWTRIHSRPIRLALPNEQKEKRKKIIKESLKKHIYFDEALDLYKETIKEIRDYSPQKE